MAGPKKLVIAASGFVGSHVTRQLVERGDDVRVMIRRAALFFRENRRRSR